MKREILVSRNDRAFAVTENGRLCEYLLEEPAADAMAVRMGRIVRIVKGIDAAFVDIGETRNGFLPLREKSESFQDTGTLREGDRVLVQIVREAHGEKGAFLTRDISLSGQYLILMPCNRFIGVSGKLSGEQAAKLRTLGSAIAGGRFGLVMRTAAAAAQTADIEREAESLWETWNGIREAAPTAPAPSSLWEKESALASLLDDYVPRGLACVVSDDPADEALCGGRCPFRLAASDPLRTAGIQEQLREASGRRIWLRSGANLVIDECEALTVIDVNTAKFTGSRTSEKHLTQANIEACGEIARQVRLRSLGGIIIIDMIDMREETDREAVLSALREAFSADRAKTVIHGYTSLGLIEMTRRRTRRSLRDMLGQAARNSGEEQ